MDKNEVKTYAVLKFSASASVTIHEVFYKVPQDLYFQIPF